jgi:hypothetical protein
LSRLREVAEVQREFRDLFAYLRLQRALIGGKVLRG